MKAKGLCEAEMTIERFQAFSQNVVSAGGLVALCDGALSYRRNHATISLS